MDCTACVCPSSCTTLAPVSTSQHEMGPRKELQEQSTLAPVDHVSRFCGSRVWITPTYSKLREAHSVMTSSLLLTATTWRTSVAMAPRQRLASLASSRLTGMQYSAPSSVTSARVPRGMARASRRLRLATPPSPAALILPFMAAAAAPPPVLAPDFFSLLEAKSGTASTRKPKSRVLPCGPGSKATLAAEADTCGLPPLVTSATLGPSSCLPEASSSASFISLSCICAAVSLPLEAPPVDIIAAALPHLSAAAPLPEPIVGSSLLAVSLLRSFMRVRRSFSAACSVKPAGCSSSTDLAVARSMA